MALLGDKIDQLQVLKSPVFLARENGNLRIRQIVLRSVSGKGAIPAYLLGLFGGQVA